MIWFFLAGFIAGAVGMVMFAGWWIKRHMVKVSPEQALRDIEELRRSEEWEEKKPDE